MNPLFYVAALAAAAYAASRKRSSSTGTGGDVKPATFTEGSLQNLPDDPVLRSAVIAGIIRGGNYDAPFTILEVARGPLRARLRVSSRALRVDGVRVSLTERDQTQVADFLGAHLLTPKLVEEIYRQADVQLRPRPQPWYHRSAGGDSSMGTARRVFDYDRIVTEELGGRDGRLVANEGKDWVVDGYAFTAAGKARGTNYGWVLPNGKLIQGIGHVHNLDHTDYSQLSRFVWESADVSLDGGKTYRPTTFGAILSDAKLFPLVSYERIPAPRHPGVPLGAVA